MTDEKPNTLKFHYIKSTLFRVVHVDGLYGGPTPKGDIQLTFYNERVAIPQQTAQVLNADGTLGPEVAEGRIGREGIVRELEVSAILDVETARGLRDWLTDQLKAVEQLVAQAKAASKGVHQ
jgi:hypothetical protein